MKLFLLLVADGSLIVSPGLFLYGNDVTERNRTVDITGFRKVWIDPNRVLPSGVLSRFFVYATASDRIRPRVPSSSISRLQIWRPARDPQPPNRPEFTLVWSRRVMLSTTTLGILYKVIRYSVTVPYTGLYFAGSLIWRDFPEVLATCNLLGISMD